MGAFFSLSGGSSSVSERTWAWQGFWQTHRVLTQPLYPRGLALHLSHLAGRLTQTDVQSASLDHCCSTGLFTVSKIISNAWKPILLAFFMGGNDMETAVLVSRPYLCSLGSLWEHYFQLSASSKMPRPK